MARPLACRLVLASAIAAATIGCGGGDDDDGAAGPDAAAADAPPATWQEHWFEHDQLLTLADYDDDVAIYFDADVDATGTEWILPYLGDLWRYTRQTYGEFGDDRLYLIFHEGRYSGGHPSTYFDESHDFRNVSDCGPGPWGDPATVDLPSHEIGHVVEIASRGVHGSPAFGLWGDSKWAEFYQYDVYVALGKTADAQRVYDRFIATTDDFPVAGTHWFRDWFYPLWRDHGHGEVMARFFELLSQNFPTNGDDYARDMTWGEYVHFMSGAAGTDLQSLATAAFGWPAEWDAQLQAARSDFPAITY